jgi:hypothetical protein
MIAGFRSLFIASPHVNLGRGRLKLTWGEAIKRDLKVLDIPKDVFS